MARFFQLLKVAFPSVAAAAPTPPSYGDYSGSMWGDSMWGPQMWGNQMWM